MTKKTLSKETTILPKQAMNQAMQSLPKGRINPKKSPEELMFHMTPKEKGRDSRPLSKKR